MDDLRQLRDEIPNLEGMISGRALYDGALDPQTALALLAAKEA